MGKLTPLYISNYIVKGIGGMMKIWMKKSYQEIELCDLDISWYVFSAHYLD
jgi:hypothetical protein